jgi:hypothetical protein
MSAATRRHLAHARGFSAKGRDGIALPAAMFALVAASILAAGMVSFADLNAKAALNQERATRAVQVADAGVSHALGLLRQSLKTQSFTQILRGADNMVPTADDSLFIGYGLPANDEIPLAGKPFQAHTYFVTVGDDPADGDASGATDLNGRVLVRCRVLTSDGATAEVTAILGAVPMPALAADGNLTLSGSPEILGPCGGAHANGNINGAGNPTVSTQATATGTATGTFKLPDNTAAPKLGGQPEIGIPDLNPIDFCPTADFRLLATGNVETVATGFQVPAAAAGWTYNAGSLTWTFAGGADGTYCAAGNVLIAGNTGSAAVPKRISILATGSIKVEGTPYLVADQEDGILLLAAGDVYLAGNAAAGATSYQGMVYAGAQCATQGTFTMFGQLLCANGTQPPGATQWAVGHTVEGNFKITFDCSANVFNKRRILYWYPRIGA